MFIFKLSIIITYVLSNYSIISTIIVLCVQFLKCFKKNFLGDFQGCWNKLTSYFWFKASVKYRIFTSENYDLLYSLECRQQQREAARRIEIDTRVSKQLTSTQTTTIKQHQPAAPILSSSHQQAAPMSPTRSTKRLLLQFMCKPNYTHLMLSQISQMTQQQATLTTNICEPTHIIINQTLAAGDSYIYCTNSN